MSATNVQLIRFQKGGAKVEVMGKPGMVAKYREGKVPLKDALLNDTIWANSSKGEVASEADLAKLGASGKELLELIVKTGKYAQTAAEKREIVEQRNIEVVNFIHDNFIDSSSRTPHPVVRIENALKEIKAHIDPEKDAEHNARALIPKLQTVIRLSESTMEAQVVIPNSKLGQCVGLVYNLCSVTREEFGPENAYLSVKFPPGKFDILNEQLSRNSGGLAVVKIEGASATSDSSEPKEKIQVKKKNKGKK